MDYSLLNSNAYKDASSLFPNLDPSQDPMVRQTINQGTTAGLQAKNQAIQNLAAQGFGHSTFGESLGNVAQAKAAKPYIESAINAQNAIKQQQIQNMLNFLGLGIGYDNQQQLLDQQRQKQQASSLTTLLGGVLPLAGSVLGGPVGGILGSMGSNNLQGNSIPGSQTAGTYLPNYKPNYMIGA